MAERDSVPSLLEHLRAGPVGVPTAEEVEAEQRRLVPWLEDRIAALPFERQRYLAARRRRRALASAGLVFAAAAGALLLWQWRAQDGEAEGAPKVAELEDGYVTLLSGRLRDGSVEILPGSRLGEASVVRSGEEEAAVLRGSSGYLAELSPGSALRLGSPGAPARSQELRLERGTVKLSVPRLPPGDTLSVLTEDARVTVRGTRFSVSLEHDGEGTPQSCVRVQEGAVEVARRGAAPRLLGPGEESGCAPSDPREGAKEPETSGAEGSAEKRDPARTSTPQASGAAASETQRSTLAREVELLGAALAAEQRGDYAKAARDLQTLLRRYPHTTLGQEARAALSRIQTRASGDPAAP